MMAIAIAFSSCTKDGATGPQGATGANGTNGSANVSSNFVVAYFALQSNGSYLSTISVPALTSSNYLNSNVSVYFTLSGYQIAMPCSSVYSNGDALDYGISSNGNITIFYNEGSTNYALSSLAVEVVVIPEYAIEAHPHTNWNDYSQVKAIINSEAK